MDKPTRLSGVDKKGWGYEMIWATNDLYCGKIMVFTREMAKTSMHFHKEKDETWFVNSGVFKVAYIDTKDSTLYEKELKEGDEMGITAITAAPTNLFNKRRQCNRS